MVLLLPNVLQYRSKVVRSKGRSLVLPIAFSFLPILLVTISDDLHEDTTSKYLRLFCVLKNSGMKPQIKKKKIK